MAEGSESSGNKIKVNVKTSKDKKEIEVNEDGTIKEVCIYPTVVGIVNCVKEKTVSKGQY